MLGRRLSTKFLHLSSGGSSLRVRCWSGFLLSLSNCALANKVNVVSFFGGGGGRKGCCGP